MPIPIRAGALAAALLISFPAVPASAQSLPDAAAPAQAALTTVRPETGLPQAEAAARLVIATFNIRCANCSGKSTKPLEKSWETRKPVIVSQLMGERPDVLGVQEASAGTGNVASGDPQFVDLVNALNAVGGSYAVTNERRYNYEVCDYPDGYLDETGAWVEPEPTCSVPTPLASQDSRIIYNTQRLQLEDPQAGQGSLALDNGGVTDGSARFMTWARFRDLVTGKRFIFATGHVEPGMDKATIGTRRAQVVEATNELNRVNTDKLPIIWGSDLASSKLSPSGNTAYDVFRSAGYTDPLGNTYKTKKSRTKYTYAKKIVNAKYFTLNDFKAAPGKNSRYKLGAHLDYILIKAVKRPVVWQWKQVLSLDAKGNFAGVIPSDHNLVTVTLSLAW